MNNPRTVEEKVRFILEHCPQTRNDDMELYLHVCNLCGSFGNVAIGSLPLAVIMKCYKEMGLPHFESVRRARAKIQAKNNDLAADPECQKGRMKLEKLYVNYAKE